MRVSGFRNRLAADRRQAPHAEDGLLVDPPVELRLTGWWQKDAAAGIT